MTLLRRIALLVVLAGSLLVGLWAQLAPRSFYDDFPGAGRVWVAVDGPFNEHLVRDVGGLNLGLAFVAGFALVTGSLLVARAAGGAALVYGTPHLLYHATHLDPFDTPSTWCRCSSPSPWPPSPASSPSPRHPPASRR